MSAERVTVVCGACGHLHSILLPPLAPGWLKRAAALSVHDPASGLTRYERAAADAGAANPPGRSAVSLRLRP